MKKNFIEFLLENQALFFGKFTLKSGRVSPYFLNMRLLCNGIQCRELGYFYATKIVETWGQDFDIVFGPAYAGIPLAVATTIALYEKYHLNKLYVSNRKEKKDYGDKGGSLIGASLKKGDRVMLIDDVMTTGDTKIEAIKILKEVQEIKVIGLLIGLDRMEKGSGEESAIKIFTKETGVPVQSIATIRDVISYVEDKENRARFHLPDGADIMLKSYLEEYGV